MMSCMLNELSPIFKFLNNFLKIDYNLLFDSLFSSANLNKFCLLVQEVQEEGRYAIDSPGSPTAPDLPPEDYALGK